ncbi:ABC transporter ATP-binding protein [Sporanaerobacter acetigenes]|uniref:ABC transporter ATP-binding protein n=1 Tax=Sporanaerobacter acetigenes TaxID=165813 RepID=UPI00332CB613
MLNVSDLTMEFGGLKALSNVDLSILQGEIHGLIGPNGSGKTTLINVITGFYYPTRGKIALSQKNITAVPPYIVARLGLVRTFQNINLFPEMTVLENVLTGHFLHTTPSLLSVLLGLPVYKIKEQKTLELGKELLNFVGLYELKNMKAKNLPYGKQRILEIARALMTLPKFLILDEPVAGMNDQESDMVSNLIRKLRDNRGITILLIEHHMRFVMNLCEKLTVLSAGKVLARGKPDEIQRDQEVISVYLGTGRGNNAKNK